MGCVSSRDRKAKFIGGPVQARWNVEQAQSALKLSQEGGDSDKIEQAKRSLDNAIWFRQQQSLAAVQLELDGEERPVVRAKHRERAALKGQSGDAATSAMFGANSARDQASRETESGQSVSCPAA
eukprot:TRINITY_DN2325_c0_g2_i2.p1 TRINITY_DN2325_c0_g2~~TRINITY_DN2325_c0_g2_i2.p1  ORF type:complete len:125 (-),score=19.13 TRINITY_DN2325_c0_g2_i2:600-974(-)